MKKKFLFIAVFFVALAGAHGVSISVFPEVSYNNNSLVYRIYDGTNLNSQLDWNSLYLVNAGGGCKISLSDFVITANALFSFPFKCGIQYDSDWRTLGIKTNYSTGDLYTDFGLDANLEVKYRFKLPLRFGIFSVVRAWESYSKFKARNIYCWCGDRAHTGLPENLPWNSENARRVKKYGIDLNNNITCFWAGAELQKSFDSFFIDFKVLVSPYICFLGIDHHLNAEEGHFYQMYEEAFFKAWNFELIGGYNLTPFQSLNLGVNFCFCPELSGDLYFGWFRTESIIADETSSVQFSSFKINLWWEFKIF